MGQQTFRVDLSAGDVSVSAADLAGCDFLDIANVPPAISVQKPRRVILAPQLRAITVRSLSSSQSAALIVCGSTVVQLPQYFTIYLALDGTPNGLQRTPDLYAIDTLANLDDVDLSNVADGDTLAWDASRSKFHAVPAGSGGGGGGSSGRALPLSKTVSASNGFNFPHSFGYQPDVWAVDAAGVPCEVGFTHAAGAVNFVFNQPFTGTVYLG